METENITIVKNKIINGVIALTSRTLLLQIVTFGSLFVLSALLDPSVFGVFYIVSAVISFLSYFSDVGLAGALIQRKEIPSDKQLSTVFTLQQLLVGSLVLLFIIFAPSISGFFNFGTDGEFLLIALLISFFISSLKTIPSVLLERKLDFSRLIIPQILETITFYGVSIILAFYGFQLKSFAFAALARGVIGLISIYYIQPWKISFSFDFSSIKELLSFGLPYQTNSVLALIKDDLMVIFLGKILPLSAVGYIGWAKKWAEVPLRLIMDSVIRVTFPTFARLQHDKKILAKALAMSAFFLALTIVPATIIMAIVIKPLIFIVPRYAKWEPALLPFYFFAFSAVLAAFSSPFVNALNAIGKIKKTLLLMLMWTGLAWTLTPFFALKMGYVGVGIAAFIISFTSIVPIWMIKSEVNFSFLSSVTRPILLSLVIFGSILIFVQSRNDMYITAGLLIFASFLFPISVWYSFKKEIVPYLPKISFWKK